jgi:hypothetical protein
MAISGTQIGDICVYKAYFLGFNLGGFATN